MAVLGLWSSFGYRLLLGGRSRLRWRGGRSRFGLGSWAVLGLRGRSLHRLSTGLRHRLGVGCGTVLGLRRGLWLRVGCGAMLRLSRTVLPQGWAASRAWLRLRQGAWVGLPRS